MADLNDLFVTNVTLADGSQAQQVKVSPGVSVEAVVSALMLPRPSTVFVLAGSADAIDSHSKLEKRVLNGNCSIQMGMTGDEP